LFGTKDEGPIVVKQLLKVKTDEEFATLRDQMRIIQSCFDTETKHPNFLTYYKESPARLNKDVTVLLR